MSTAENPTLLIQDLLRALYKKKWMIFGCIVLAVSVGGVLCLVLPKSYRSSTLILVEDQKIPEQYVKGTIGGTIEERLLMIQQQVMSRSLLSRIIEEFGLYKDEIKREGMDTTIENMRKQIKVDTVGTTGRQGKTVEAFTISFAHEKPAMAQKVTEKLAGQFIEENLKVREQLVTGAADFLDQELRGANQRLQEKEAAISEFKAAHIGELPQQLEANLRTLDRLASERNASAEAVALLTDRLRAADKTIAEYNSSGAMGLDGPVPQRVLDPRIARLKELERNETALASEYKSTYPDLISVRREIDSLKKELSGKASEGEPAKEGGVDKSKMYDPYLQGLVKQRNDVRSELAAANEHLQRISRQMKELETKVEQAPAREQELLVLLRDYENMQKNYQALLAKQLDAKVAQNLERRQQGEQFRVIDPANYPDKPDSPNVMRIMLVSLAAGCGIGIGGVLLVEQAKPVFRRAEEVEALLGLHVLGAIPDFSLVYGMPRVPQIGVSTQDSESGERPVSGGKTPSKFKGLWDRVRRQANEPALRAGVPDEMNWITRLCPTSMVAEQYRVVATRVSLLGLERKSTVVVVTSAVKGEGKTTTAVNLAYALARDLGKLTLLIDADLKAPKVHTYAGISNEVGLLDLLKRRDELDDRMTRYTHRVNESPLWVMPTGGGDAPTAELVDVQRIARLLTDLRTRFEYIVIDAPPVLPLADMNILAQMADVLSVVVRAEQTPQPIVTKALSMLKPTSQVGVILNGMAGNCLPSYYYPYNQMKSNVKMIGV